MKRTSEHGQVLLVVVLVLAVTLTVGLSLAARTVTNLKLSKQNEESQRAFQAAESGVENALKQTSLTGPLSAGDLQNQSSYKAIVRQTGGAKDLLINNGDPILQDVGIDVWLSHHNNGASDALVDFAPSTQMNGGAYSVYFGDPSANLSCAVPNGSKVPPAVEVVALTGTAATPTITKIVADPCSRITGATRATSGTFSAGGKAFAYSATITLPSNGLIAKVIPLYNSTPVGMVSPSSNFVSQGSLIDSTGTSGDTTRKVTYYAPYPQLPTEYFSYALLSQ